MSRTRSYIPPVSITRSPLFPFAVHAPVTSMAGEKRDFDEQRRRDENPQGKDGA